MRLAKVLAASAVLLAFCAGARAGATPQVRTYRDALGLYEAGMYSESRALFEGMGDDMLCRGYGVLCALKMRSADAMTLADAYVEDCPSSTLVPQILYEKAAILFDAGEYDAAAACLDKVKVKALSKKLRSQYYFRRGYCDFAGENYLGARRNFGKVDALPASDYSAPARYALGFMDYTDHKFVPAEGWFKLAQPDSRFTEICDFYILDCEFMGNKNYDYVIENGPAMYEASPVERQPYLARIISESYLVKGNAASAREFFEKGNVSQGTMTRSDYFYAGTVMYESLDYEGAIENYTKMVDRSDSLGQIASYQLAYSYIKTRNKVLAMDAFKEAVLDFDPQICEDAYFNWAKLAFDLNEDPSVFESYLKRYSTTVRGEQMYVYMALSALYRRDYDAAIEAYDRIDELDGDMKRNYVKANFLRAEQLIGNASYSAAVPYLKAAVFYLSKYDKFGQLSKYWLGESYYNSESWQNAAKEFTELYNNSALQGRQEGYLLPYNVAYSYFKDSEWASAAKWFDVYIRSGNSICRKDALYRRADCDFVNTEYAAAADSYATAAAEFDSPDEIYPYYQRGICLGLIGKNNDKITTLKKVLDASPKAPLYSEALYELGRAYLDGKKTSDAVSVFDRLKKTASDNTYVGKALIGLGMTYRNAGKYEEALESYKEAVVLLPGTEVAEDALMSIESIYNKLKHPEKYVAFVESAGLVEGKSDADREILYFNSAEQLFVNENWEQASVSLQKLLETYPQGEKSADAHFYLAESYRNLGRKEKACEQYAAAIASQGGSYTEQAILNYADLSYSLERYTEAYGLYEKLNTAARFDENRLKAFAGMMRSAYRARNYAAAVSDAQYVLSNDNSGASVKREAKYVLAKSLLAQSRRDEAFRYFKDLAAQPSTAEGAEASYMLIKDCYDKGDFAGVADKVYDFSAKAGSQNYWIAKSYIVLGDSFRELGNAAQAKATYESLRDGYEPYGSGDDVPQTVAERLEQLSKMN